MSMIVFVLTLVASVNFYTYQDHVKVKWHVSKTILDIDVYLIVQSSTSIMPVQLWNAVSWRQFKLLYPK